MTEPPTLSEDTKVKLKRWKQVCKVYEDLAEDRRKAANEPLPAEASAPAKDLGPESIILRDNVWKDYNYRKQHKICSRCGDYHRYEIVENKIPIQRELNRLCGSDFYNMEYRIEVTTILNEGSLDIEDGGNLCSKCREHTIGRQAYFLLNSQQETEDEVRHLKQKERERRMFQDDDIKKVRKEFREELKDSGGERQARHV